MKFYKTGSFDKYDAHTPNAKSFPHKNSQVSYEVEYFSVNAGYKYARSRKIPGVNFGVDKKLWCVSGHGYYVDSCYAGKGDQQ